VEASSDIVRVSTHPIHLESPLGLKAKNIMKARIFNNKLKEECYNVHQRNLLWMKRGGYAQEYFEIKIFELHATLFSKKMHCARFNSYKAVCKKY
jgi:hypothetical protein